MKGTRDMDESFDMEDVIIVGHRALMKKNSFLSNFYECPVFYKGLLYGSSESAYQAQKCRDESLKSRFSYGGEWSSPMESKNRGNEVELVDNWDGIKDSVMFDVVLNKFVQNKEIGNKLIELRHYDIEEANGHGDTYWGTVDGVGENKLGLILDSIANILTFIGSVGY